MSTSSEWTILFAIVFVVVIGTIAIVTVLDIVRRPSNAFVVTPLRKWTWVGIAVVLDVGSFFSRYVGYAALGFIAYYFLRVRPRLKTSRRPE